MIFSSKLKNLALRIEFMQKRMTDKVRTAGVKIEILQVQWERIEYEIKFLAQRIGSPPEV